MEIVSGVLLEGGSCNDKRKIKNTDVLDVEEKLDEKLIGYSRRRRDEGWF